MIQSLRKLGIIGSFLNFQSVSAELLNQQKTELFPLKIGNKSRISAFITHIQVKKVLASIVRQKKGNKRNTDWKKRNKTVPFADGIVVYIENARNVFFKTLETVHEFSKVTAYKVNA